jgi:hypothetical protein
MGIDLREIVRQTLEESGRSQEEFALSYDLDHDAFRTQLARNHFSPVTLKAIAQLLNKPVEQLKSEYNFSETRSKFAGSISALTSTERKLARSLRIASHQISSYLEQLYMGLGKGDLAVIFALNEPPLETIRTEWTVIGKSLTTAVTSGATFVYVRPTQIVYRNFFQAMPTAWRGPSPSEQHSLLLSYLLASGVSRADVDERVLLMELDWCPFWCVGMRFGYYALGDLKGAREDGLFARFPYGGGGRSSSSRDSSLMLYSDRATREACCDFLHYAFTCDQKFARASKLLAKNSTGN